MSAQWKWVISIVSVVVVIALLACGIFFAWRYLFAGKPSVVITAPPSNYQAEEGDEVTVEARATGRSIVRLELWVDDGLMDSVSSPSPQDAFSAALTWQASGAGSHIAEVRAYDTRGQASEPAAIVLTVATGVAEVTPTITVEPSETPTPTTSPTGTPTSTPEATPTPTSPAPTATPTETPTPEPTDTPTPTVTPCPAVADFWADPDTVEVNVKFKVKWHVECVSAIYLSGPGVGDHEPITGPDGEKELSHPNPGDYDYTLHVEALSGDFDKQVTVTVNPASPVEIYNFVEHMCDATWTSEAGTLPCPGSHTDNRGFVRAVGGMELEDHSTPPKALQTHPQWINNGWIQGKYHLPWPIQQGDRFVAKVGFLKDAPLGRVRFMLVCSTNGTGGTAWETTKPYNNSLVDVSVQLPPDCVGVSYLTLRVLADGPSSQDWAVWVNPRLRGTPR